jgi:hypothetical protein
MKVGDNVVIVSKFGEFQCYIEGKIISFYRDDRAIVTTEAGHDWAIKKSELRVVEKNRKSGWVN